MADEEEEEEGFGDFMFAPSKSKATVDDGDDDWGDFMTNSGGLTHTLSSPMTSLKPAFDSFAFISSDQKRNLDSGSDPVHPGSAPGRIESNSAWSAKPRGAIPLSIFGVEEEDENEEEEGSSMADPSFRDQGGSFLTNGNKGPGGPNLRDLVAGSYKQGQLENGSVLDSSSGGKASSLGAIDVNLTSNGLVVKGGNNDGGLRMSGVGLEWDPLDFNANGVILEEKSVVSVLKDVNLSANGSSSGAVDGNEGFDDGGPNENDEEEEEDDDGWEFKIADVNTAFKEEVPMANQIEAGSSVSKFASSWNSTNLDFTFWNAEANGVTSNVSWFSSDPATDNEKVGGNHLWEFTESDSSTKLGIQNSQLEDV